MRVLLCLLSDQHVPNLLSIHHYRPDRLVLVESEVMHRRHVARNLLDAIQCGGLEYENRPGDDRCHIEPLEHEDNLDAIRSTLRRAYARYPGAEWLVNVTGGNKPMSIATYDFFSGLIRRGVLNGRIVYTNVAQPGRIIDLDNHATEDVLHRLSAKQFLAGYGFESRKPDPKLDAGETLAHSAWECARAIALREGTEPLLYLNDDERSRARGKGLELKPRHLAPANESIWESFATCFSLPLEDGRPCGKINKHAVQFLTGGWLEVFLWGLLKNHADALNIWDVRLGLEVGRRGDTTGNDFDIAFMRDNGLCMVECKSGAQSHDPAADILYKIEAVIRQFRALRVQSWLATTSANVLDPQTGQLKASIATRAAIHGCRTILHAEIQRLAAAPDDQELVKTVLFSGNNN